MEKENCDNAPRSRRPYFVPAEVDFDALPEQVRLAFAEIVQPAYDSFVLNAVSPLERCTGVTLTFLLTSELLAQFGLGQQLNYSGLPDASEDEPRDRRLRQYLRLVGAKQHAADFLIRLQVLREKYSPPAWQSP